MDVIGTLQPPQSVISDLSAVGPKFFTPIIGLIVVIAGIWAFLQLLLGGLGYITAGGDPKKITEAQSKIMHAVIGMAIIAASFFIIGIIGYLFFNSPTYFLSPTLQAPGSGSTSKSSK